MLTNDGARFWGTVSILFGLDQATKYAARVVLDHARVIDFGLLQLNLVFNKGAAYGILTDFTVVLTIIGVLVIAYLTVQLRTLIVNRVTFLSYAFLLAGAMGNTIDRLLFGQVTDFLNIHIIPVFNVADVCLNIGLGLLLVHFFWYERRV